MRAVPDVEAAKSTAEALLAPLGDRWLHTRSVAARAAELVAVVLKPERDLLVVAAWWHDLGYAPELKATGMHQVDGARYLVSLGYPQRLCALIAHHSAATYEADERGLLEQLSAWPREESPLADALWTADMTTGPDGARVVFKDRLEEILQRYPPNSAVARAMRRAQPSIEAAIARTHARLSS